MREFTDYSIDLMEALAHETSDAFSMTRRGYLPATRHANIDDLMADLDRGFGHAINGNVRLHTEASSGTYQYSPNQHWSEAPNGVEVLNNRRLITDKFQSISGDISNLVHIRRAATNFSQKSYCAPRRLCILHYDSICTPFRCVAVIMAAITR
ncbi:MAG: hypothetical protein OER97_04485 [Gammaproteobacteria bacterium]|nr:hypothetical protein [Gammaproteobacteria bacterium]